MKILYVKILLCLIIVQIAGACKEKEGEAELPTVSIFDVSMQEGRNESEAQWTARLSALSTKEVIFRYQTNDGTALAGEDYAAKSGEVRFAAGETEKNISVTVKGDAKNEPNEDFFIALSGAENCILERARIKATLFNDDTSPEGYSTPLSYPGRQLVWNDEFDGNQLNTAVWTAEQGNNNGWGNNELQYYRAENATVSDGYLTIEARRQSLGGFQYTSSRLKTEGKKEFTFGRIDIRATLPEGKGIWPALWMLGGNISKVGWPACGEIDIMELVGHEPGKVHGTAHYGPDFTRRRSKGNSISLPAGEKFSDKFHVFSIDWNKDKIVWLMDDKPFFEITAAELGLDYSFNQPFFFLFNIAVGGNWPGSPDNTTVMPQRMTVDYVRVFQ